MTHVLANTRIKYIQIYKFKKNSSKLKICLLAIIAISTKTIKIFFENVECLQIFVFEFK